MVIKTPVFARHCAALQSASARWETSHYFSSVFIRSLLAKSLSCMRDSRNLAVRDYTLARVMSLFIRSAPHFHFAPCHLCSFRWRHGGITWVDGKETPAKCCNVCLTTQVLPLHLSVLNSGFKIIVSW